MAAAGALVVEQVRQRTVIHVGDIEQSRHRQRYARRRIDGRAGDHHHRRMVLRPLDFQVRPSAEHVSVVGADQKIVGTVLAGHERRVRQVRRRRREDLIGRLRHAVLFEMAAAQSGVIEHVGQRVVLGIGDAEQIRHQERLARRRRHGRVGDRHHRRMVHRPIDVQV